MGLILCPECRRKISDKAIVCPHCGYMGEDHSCPISRQDAFEIVPVFNYDIEKWDSNESQFSIVNDEDNKILFHYLGNWENIQLKMPAIAKVIKSMADKDKIFGAKMDSYVKTLIDKGVYRFTIDKNGEILPTIRDAEGIVKQVRLEEITCAPELINSLNNLMTHAAMTQILDEIKYVGEAIKELHIELQNDRIALAESSKDKLLQAAKIKDAGLREIAILNAVNSATEAKRVLMRNFSDNLKYVSGNTNRSDIKLIFEGRKEKEIQQRVSDAFQALVLITNSVQVECEGYSMLGEYDASKESLFQFNRFILENKLEDKDTLLLLNENTSQKKMPLVDKFMKISERITNFNADKQLSECNIFKITEAN